MNKIIKYILISLISLAIYLTIFACNTEKPEKLVSEPNTLSDNQVLKIWWEQGFYAEEDQAFRVLVAEWEKQTGNKVKLSFYPIDSISRETQRWLKAGNPPDIMFGRKAQRSLNPSLAWSGKLADVSEVIEPVKNQYPDSVLEAAKLYNQSDNRQRSYYGVPIHQATIHLFYWRDLLEQAGFDDSQIPQDWDDFWQFWALLPDKLRLSSSQTDSETQNIYGLGLPFSVKASDTYFTFEQILEAYDAQILDTKGQLLVEQPNIRRNIINSLAWYTKFYQQGYVPPAAIDWLNPDNNRDFLNRSILMTPNPSLSIPGTVRQDEDIYRNRLGILNFPLKPNGKPISHLVTVTQAVVFADSPRQQLAKEFLAYLIQPEIITTYLKASGDRNLPVHKSVWQDPYWTNPENPHLAHASRILTTEQTRPFYVTQNPAYSIVLQENIWGQALNRIVVDNLSPEQAADEAIARIKEIFEQWDKEDR